MRSALLALLFCLWSMTAFAQGTLHPDPADWPPGKPCPYTPQPYIIWTGPKGEWERLKRSSPSAPYTGCLRINEWWVKPHNLQDSRALASKFRDLVVIRFQDISVSDADAILHNLPNPSNLRAIEFWPSLTHGMDQLPASIGRFKNLQSLKILYWTGGHFPDVGGHFPNLTDLRVRSVKPLSVPSWIPDHPALQNFGYGTVAPSSNPWAQRALNLPFAEVLAPTLAGFPPQLCNHPRIQFWSPLAKEICEPIAKRAQQRRAQGTP